MNELVNFKKIDIIKESSDTGRNYLKAFSFLRDVVNPKSEEERYINYTIEAIMISILHELFYTNTSLG